MMYVYNVKLDRVVDGDTVDLTVDLGFHVNIKERFRLLGIDAPESRTRDLAEKKRGGQATFFLQKLIDDSEFIILDTFKDRKGKFGRWLATLYDDRGNNLNEMMVDHGHAVKYDGGKR